jgi:hypothetical protein
MNNFKFKIMALAEITVRRRKEKLNGSAKNYASESQAYDTTRFISAIPSICKKDGQVDGLVNAMVEVDQGDGANTVVLWVTETVTAVAALS